MYVSCPSCSKNFKITAAVLGQAKGLVRCGSCRHVFNALPLLKDDPVLPVPLPQVNLEEHIVEAKKVEETLPPKEEPAVPEYTAPPKKKFRFLGKEIAFILALAAMYPLGIKIAQRPSPIPQGKDSPTDTVVENPIPVLVQPSSTAQVKPPLSRPNLKNENTVLDSVVASTFGSSPLIEAPKQVISSSGIDDQNVQPIITFDTRSPDELMSEARSILSNRNGPYDKAMDDLRSIILSQPADKAKEAREMLGYAYEKSRMLDKAMHEYQQYLALYPDDNEDRIRVRQRLMTLEILDPALGSRGPASVLARKEPRKGDSFGFHGNYSNYFYLDQAGNTKQLESLSAANLVMELQHNQYDLTSRVRFSKVRDFSSSVGNKTVFSTAYVDFQDTFKGYDVRLGRQPSEAGAISRFDGVSTKMSLTDDLKVSLAAGTPYIGPSEKTSRKFGGVGLDWSVNRDLTLGAYLNRETADNFLERSAVGATVQYFDNNTNALLRTEYDSVYHTLNMVTFQAMKYAGPYDFFIVYDRRKSPLPYGDIALGLGLLGPSKEVYGSVGDIVSKSGLGSSDIYTYIASTTPIATAFVLGANKKLNKDWMATVNFQSSNISSTPGFNVAPQFDPVPLQLGEKNTYSVNLHLKGDNVYAANNTVEFVANKGVGATKSFYITAADEFRYGDKKQNSFSAIVRYDDYVQSLIHTHTTTGIIRGFYEVGQNKMMEAQFSKTLAITTPLNGTPQPNTNQTFYLGFRYDF